MKWKLSWRRFAVHILFGWFRPSWLRYQVSDAEYGTVRIGFAQIKWTRLLRRRPRVLG